MKKYFVEFEFNTPIENRYWFPLFITAKDLNQAKISAKTVETALKEHYKVIQSNIPKLYVEGINSDFINLYIKSRFVGNIAIIKFDVWQFEEILTIPELNFSEHLKLIEFEENLTNKNIAKIIASHNFPVRSYSSNSKFDFKEYLLVNVVDPLKVEELYICITLTKKEFENCSLQSINEGIWKDSHLTGYKVRVDAPHTPDGKRHVHIAHSKHVTAKNQQVSWNDDCTRHDKKSFNVNFKGIERAKEIARNELGLKNDAILENINKGYKIVLESSESSQRENEIIYLHIKQKE